MKLVFLLDLSENVDWHVAFYRLLSTVIGGGLAVAGAYFLWPSWETQHFPFRISKALLANKNYLNQIKSTFTSKTGFHPRVLAHKRKAEVENINLEGALMVMRNEPYRIRKKIKNAQKFADFNRLLTKHLSYLASFLPELKSLNEFPEAVEFIDFVTSALEKLAAGIEPGESRKIKNELEMNLLVMESKLALLKDDFDSVLNSKMTLEAWILPYELVVIELKKIAGPIKEMILLTDDMIEVQSKEVAK